MASAGPRQNVLFDDSDDESDGGVNLKVNDAYAKRFEHNKKREELHRLEEKYKSKQAGGSNSKDREDDEEDESSSDETEDDEGFLATEELDAQISATLQAIKSKDPRLYDGKSTFYTPIDEDASDEPAASKQKKEKPMFLQDYHRERLMRGDIGADDQAEEAPPQTYAQEQDNLKKSLQNEIQAQLKAAGDDEDSDGDEGFMKAKEGTKASITNTNGIHPSRATKVKVPVPDVKEADKDPELFLSNFLASRAWAQEEGNGWQPFESDGEEDEKADEWEAAYNMRFEDPSKSNEVLRSYARDVTASISVRREEKTGRKRQRELEKENKEAEKTQRKEERARLRRLKLEEAESKLEKIKKAAGFRGKMLKDEEWQKVLESAWENDEWEEEMNKIFNDEYYAQGEEEVSDEDEDAVKKSKRKVKKPKWDDDIDIKDLVPDFDDEERANFTLTDDEEAAEEQLDEQDEDTPAAKRRKTSKEQKKERLASQKEARKERAKLEALVDAHMSLEDPEILNGASSSKNAGQSKFGYIETKPESFGLTTRDILMASDADLNNFVGLKKLAHWRDQEKQSKDRKRLGKKARLRQWRKDTFGPEFEREPPALNFGRLEKEKPTIDDEDGGNIVEGSKKKRKRSRPKKEGKGKGVATAE
ncbi:hypothetical protein ONZ43_g2926 [Nemania bipapillata]|uniref:Uncharacterized protein n=1 Tax=Nemania bipapillata TaxID=110536 RepID=A0ACC2IZ41_9PEZI|nr:hypothetical protein ONZ43_g2926 [Nemania bipapillata]